MRVLARSFAVQGSWNYRSLIGTGFLFSLLPALREIYADQPEEFKEATRRHSALFNSHPYLAPLALGAVVAMEQQGEDPRLIERFKTAVCGSLGGLGDRLIWAGWRPACLLLALIVLLAGAPWWFGVLGFLVVYNAGHLLVRCWAYGIGLREGKAVGERLPRSGVIGISRGLGRFGAFLVGFGLPLVASGSFLASLDGAGEVAQLSWLWVALAGGAAVIGLRWGTAVRTPVVLALAVFVGLGIALKGFL